MENNHEHLTFEIINIYYLVKIRKKTTQYVPSLYKEITTQIKALTMDFSHLLVFNIHPEFQLAQEK